MLQEVLAERIREYNADAFAEQGNVLREMMQGLILASLARARFFSCAGLVGGAGLRLLHGLSRYTEDLCFFLKKPDLWFEWSGYLEQMRRDLEDEGIKLDVLDRSGNSEPLNKAFYKAGSVEQVLVLNVPYARDNARRVRIGLKVDANPPCGSTFETRYITFPATLGITAVTLASGFAITSHALVCRGHTRGRDWYDWLWYTSRRILPNFALLEHALFQQGPWAGGETAVTPDWYLKTLRGRIEESDWRRAGKDAAPFLCGDEGSRLDVWSKAHFLYHIRRLEAYLNEES